jgi:chromosome segregation ATPase
MTGWARPSARTARNNGPDESPEDDGAVALVPRRPDPALVKLEEGYNKVIDLIDAIKRHQQAQQERAAEVTDSLGQAASTLERIDATNRQQADQLAIIIEESRAGAQRTARWEDALGEFPKMAEAQREALAHVVRQLEQASRRDVELAGSLDSFRAAVQTLGDATTASSVALKDLQRASLEQQERIASLVGEQNKRFTMLFAVTLVLAATGIVAGIVSILQRG